MLRWLLIALALLALLSALALWSWGQLARRAQGPPAHALAPQPDATALDRLVAPLLAAHPDASAAALVTRNVQAFTLRAQTARAAQRSLDVQYYIWRDDLTGRLLKNELLAAAERGVRVRLLIDDMNTAGRDDLLLAMDAHPQLEVRLFNPARNRSTTLRRAIEMGLRFVSVNRRMHNKAWIADGRVALVGGRNVGDEYFDAAQQVNFHDADLLLLGPAVAQASAIFDAFWNSAEVIPLRALHPGAPAADAGQLQRRRSAWLQQLRASDYLHEVQQAPPLADSLHGALRLHWTPRLRVLSDPPQKAAAFASRRAPAHWLMYDLQALLYSARRENWLVSPYFVPGEAGTLLFAGQAARGMDVRVLTNSLAATDVAVVHAGYLRYRPALLAAGVHLYELRRGSAESTYRMGSSGASLHTKAVVVDGQRGFVGSFNFDPRSAQLNTEMGVMFDDAALAAEVRAMVAHAMQPAASYELQRDAQGGLRWLGTPDAQGTRQALDTEPDTEFWQRALVRVLSWLPIESQL